MRILRALPYKLVQLLLAMMILSGVAAAEAKSVIRGTVTTLGPGDTPVYLPGVEVVLRCEKVAGNKRTTFTDETGQFSLLDLAPDKCSVTASLEGFRSETKTVIVSEKATADLSFQLELKTVAERRRKP